MPRLTAKNASGEYTASQSLVTLGEDGLTGPLVDRLAAFEDLQESVLQKQAELSEEMERLRLAGKEKSARFRECMGRKLSNSYLLSLMQAQGL